VNAQTQAVLFNAVPLLVLAALYLSVTAALAPALWRERGRARGTDAATVLVFPCVGIAAALVGALSLATREPLAGHLWLSFAATLVGLVPGVAFVVAVARRGGGFFDTGSVPDADIVFETARLLRESERRLAEQTALFEAGQALTSDLHLDSVLERLVEEVRALLGADAADCWMFDESGRRLVCRAVRGLPESQVGRSILPEGTVGEAIASGKPVLRRDFATTEQPPPSKAYAVFAEVMDAPFETRGTVRGVLGVCSLKSRRFDERDLQLLDTFAGLASVTVRNAETFEDSLRQAQVQSGFYRMASVLGAPLSAEATLDAVAQAAAEALGGEAAAVLRPRGERLVVAGVHALPDALRTFLAGESSALDVLTAAARDGRVLAASNAQKDDRFGKPFAVASKAAGCRSLLAVPVEDARGGEGGLVLVLFAQERTFRDEDLELARQLAAAARGALERSELFELERRSRALAQQLARAGQELAGELDPAAVLDAVVELAPQLLDAAAASIRSLDGDELVVVSASGSGAEQAIAARTSSTAWLVGDIVQTRTPVAVADTSVDGRMADVDPMLAAGYGAYLGVPVLEPDGAIHGILAVYDVEPRIWREEEIDALRALAASAAGSRANADLYQRVALERERSFAILANVADGIVAVDREGLVVLWNAAAERITGVPQSEALGLPPAQVLGRSLEGGAAGARGSRLVSIRRGAEDVWLSLSEAVMTDPAGGVAGRIFAFRDISDERAVEQMKSDFVSTVSHELRTPLTSIYGFAETLLRQDVLFGEPERQTFLRYIASESERLTAIVDRLLSVAQLDTGEMTVQLATTDVAEAVVAAVRDAEVVHGSNGHTVVLSLEDGPLAAEADADKLVQVLSHLLDNAIRYSPDGGTVTVAARLIDGAVEVAVEDEGLGIPQAERERIFRKFYRGESAARIIGAGSTGLGLFIAEGLVHAMGGRIWVDSAEGEGSRFVVKLPAAVVER